jgi:hypothetical protein
MHLINKVGLFLIVLAVLSSCKKEASDRSSPQIEIVQPGHLSTYFSVDTITIGAVVSDDQLIKSVAAKLIGVSGETFAVFGEANPMSESFEYNRSLELNRPDLPQGPYFIEFSASDGVNSKKVFREIIIMEVPLVLNATYISSGSNSSQSIDVLNGTSISNVLTQANDVLALFPSYFKNQLLVVSGTGGQVKAFEHPDFNQKWSYDIENNTPFRSISAASFNQQTGEILIGDSDGFARVLNNTGNVVLGFSSDQALYKPVSAVLTESIIYFVERRLDGSDQNFNAYFRSTGALKLRLNLNGIVVSMFEDRSTTSAESHDEVVLFLNTSSGPEIKVFHAGGGGFSVPIGLPQGTLRSACKIGRHRYVFQIDDKIYHYTFSGPLQIYAQGMLNFSEMQYDKLSNLLVCVADAGLSYYAIQGGGLQLAGTVPAPQSKHVALLFNR